MGKPKERGLVVEITSRQEAQAKGLTRYFTGVPCKRGHIAERFVSTRACAGCLAVHSAALSPDKRAVYRRKFRSSPAYTEYLDRTRAYRTQKSVESAKANPEATKASKRRWNHANSHLWREYYASHAKRCRAAQPVWLTAEQKAEILTIYKQAAAMSNGPWHVDHIIPLKGSTVCGLHVPWNLRIIPAAENRSKGARLIDDLAAA